MLHQTVLFLGQLWQLFEVSQILEFLRYIIVAKFTPPPLCPTLYVLLLLVAGKTKMVEKQVVLIHHKESHTKVLKYWDT